MTNRYEYEGVIWIDVESPGEDEIDAIAQEFELGSFLSRELLSPTAKPRTDLYPEFAYTVLHFPALRSTHGVSSTQEVDIVMGKKFIVTVHYDAIPAIYDFARSFEAAMLLQHPTGGKFHTGHVLLELMERLYQSVDNEIESLEDNAAVIEQQIYAGHEREMVISISTASRELLNQKRALATHKEVLESLEQVGISLFGESLGNYFRAVSAFHFRVYNRVLELADTITELRETNDSLLSTRQNEVMKNLTMMAFVTFPLTLIATLFAMPAAHKPIIGMPYDFWIISGGMVVLALCFLFYFKHRHWL